MRRRVRGGVVKALLAALLFAQGCVCLSLLAPFDCSNAYVGQPWDHNEMVRLTFRGNVKTPLGVTVDTSGHPVDLKAIDEVLEETAACLGVSLRPCGLRVKIAPDFLDFDGRLAFPCGQDGTFVCEGAIMYPATMVVTPSFRKSLRHEAIHILGQQPGHGEAFQRCSQ